MGGGWGHGGLICMCMAVSASCGMCLVCGVVVEAFGISSCARIGLAWWSHVVS